MADLIDRQAVNDALDKTCDIVCQYSKKQRYAMCGACPLGSAYDVIENMPSAQPDVPDTNVGDLISRKKTYEVLTSFYHHNTDAQHMALHEALSKVSSADVVEVIRCKDCNWYDISDELCLREGMCMDNEDFCSYGEQKDG